MGSCTLSQASATLLPQALPRVARAGGAGCRRGQGDGIGVIAAHSLQGSIKKLGEIVAVINFNSTHTNLMPVSCPPSCAGPLRAVSCGEGAARADTPPSGIWSTFRVEFFAQGAMTGYFWPISPISGQDTAPPSCARRAPAAARAWRSGLCDVAEGPQSSFRPHFWARGIFLGIKR